MHQQGKRTFGTPNDKPTIVVGERLQAILTEVGKDKKLAAEMMMSPLMKSIEQYVMESQFNMQEELIDSETGGDRKRGRIDECREILSMFADIRKELEA